jgi:hypothetical protein
MAYRFESSQRRPAVPVAGPSPPVAFPVRARELAQAYAQDVVVAAAVFQPNAPGNWDLSPRGFGARQLLKARGAYLAERVVVAVTPLEVYAITLHFRGRVRRCVGRWPRSQLVGRSVPPLTVRPPGPAILLTRRDGRDVAELRACASDEESTRLLALLADGSVPRQAT